MACLGSAPTRSAAPCMRPGTAGKRGGVGARPAWSCASASTQVLSPSPIRMPRQKGADRAGLHAWRLSWPGALVRGRGWSVPGGAAAGQQLAAARPPRDPAARVCPGRHLQDPDPVPSCHRPGAPQAGRQLHQPDPAWLAQGAARGDPGDDAVTRRAARCRGDPPRLGGLAGWPGGRLHLATELPLLRMLLVWDNLTGHKTAEMVVWLCQHGVMPLYTPLGGSWLDMAEVVFPQMTKTDLLTTRAGGQGVTDLHVGVRNDHPVDEQQDELAALFEARLGQAPLHPLSERLQ